MRDCSDYCKYITVHAGNLLIVLKDPQIIIQTLLTKYKFKLKGIGTISYYLGCNFFRDNNRISCFAPSKHIEKMASNYKAILRCKPYAKVYLLFEKGDYLELGTSELLDAKSTQKYYSLISPLQQTISLGSLDVNTAMVTMLSF